MKINADGLFLKGGEHVVCEDYSLFSKEGELPFAIICDGCSGSKYTSVGARIIAHACRTVLLEMEDYERAHVSHAELGLKIINKAYEASLILHEQPDMLDATLICAFSDQLNERIIVMVYGDGSVTWKDKSGAVKHMSVDFPSGYPRYLSYLLSPSRQQLFEQMSSDGMNQNWVTLGEEPEAINMDVTEPTYVIIPMNDVQWVMACSDGLDTFADSAASRRISKNEVLTELSNVKGLHGEFIGRRVNRMVKQYQKEGVMHGDDLSVAGLSLLVEEA